MADHLIVSSCRLAGGVENKLGAILLRRMGGAIDQITLLGLNVQFEGLAFGVQFVSRGLGGVDRLRRNQDVRHVGVITTSKATGSIGANAIPSDGKLRVDRLAS